MGILGQAEAVIPLGCGELTLLLSGLMLFFAGVVPSLRPSASPGPFFHPNESLPPSEPREYLLFGVLFSLSAPPFAAE